MKKIKSKYSTTMVDNQFYSTLTVNPVNQVNLEPIIVYVPWMLKVNEIDVKEKQTLDGDTDYASKAPAEKALFILKHFIKINPELFTESPTLAEKAEILVVELTKLLRHLEYLKSEYSSEYWNSIWERFHL